MLCARKTTRTIPDNLPCIMSAQGWGKDIGLLHPVRTAIEWATTFERVGFGGALAYPTRYWTVCVFLLVVLGIVDVCRHS